MFGLFRAESRSKRQWRRRARRNQFTLARYSLVIYHIAPPAQMLCTGINKASHIFMKVISYQPTPAGGCHMPLGDWVGTPLCSVCAREHAHSLSKRPHLPSPPFTHPNMTPHPPPAPEDTRPDCKTPKPPKPPIPFRQHLITLFMMFVFLFLIF